MVDPNALEEDSCTLQGSLVVLPRVADSADTLPLPPRVAWAMLTAPRPGAALADVLDAYATAAAHAARRLDSWGAAVDLTGGSSGRKRESGGADAESHVGTRRGAVAAMQAVCAVRQALGRLVCAAQTRSRVAVQ